ncbi:hypothetical protein D3C87_34480 [compost metagenome]
MNLFEVNFIVKRFLKAISSFFCRRRTDLVLPPECFNFPKQLIHILLKNLIVRFFSLTYFLIEK